MFNLDFDHFYIKMLRKIIIVQIKSICLHINNQQIYIQVKGHVSLYVAAIKMISNSHFPLNILHFGIIFMFSSRIPVRYTDNESTSITEWLRK